MRDIPFSYVIEAITGCKILPIQEQDVVLDEIYEKAVEVVKWAQTQDFGRLRPNEICNRLERKLRELLGGEIPEGRTAGYPNILLRRDGRIYYIEVKLAGRAQLDSNLRTFYYQATELTKVKFDAYHVGVGFIHEGKRIIGFKIFDISRIRVSLKPEFNTSNRELYKPGNVIREYSHG
ncbi:hypothetical protein DRO32_00035 [Candidatus Bathyarchaeota archaeon]|nr:MAG: hypothetical protein DRO32_00035 [Candidatus Bathyarchaeota archaeon]